ncbi:hypothetical protein [Streptomyces sp. KMM 9044]|uniref:hypothetical protein n=1 Tax=Streptomyces sp. KMM 9044 TaxID=2744474 RepID=UPI00216FB919
MGVAEPDGLLREGLPGLGERGGPAPGGSGLLGAQVGAAASAVDPAGAGQPLDELEDGFVDEQIESGIYGVVPTCGVISNEHAMPVAGFV